MFSAGLLLLHYFCAAAMAVDRKSRSFDAELSSDKCEA